MQLLELAERGYHIGGFSEFLCLGDQLTFGLEVLPEVEVAEFLVHLQAVIEQLHNSLIVLPQVSLLAGSHVLDFLELGLELLETGIMEVDIVDVLNDVLDVINNLALGGEVGSQAFLLFSEELRTPLLELREKILEFELRLVRLGSESLRRVAGIEEFGHLTVELFGTQGMECLFYGSHFLVARHVAALHDFAQGIHQFFLGHGVPVLGVVSGSFRFCRRRAGIASAHLA